MIADDGQIIAQELDALIAEVVVRIASDVPLVKERLALVPGNGLADAQSADLRILSIAGLFADPDEKQVAGGGNASHRGKTRVRHLQFLDRLALGPVLAAIAGKSRTGYPL